MSAYHKARGSQSLNGMSSLAACLTSSSSTIPLTRCSACRLATLNHSTSGGRWECALQEKKISTFKITVWFVVTWNNRFVLPSRCRQNVGNVLVDLVRTLHEVIQSLQGIWCPVYLRYQLVIFSLVHLSETLLSLQNKLGQFSHWRHTCSG